MVPKSNCLAKKRTRSLFGNNRRQQTHDCESDSLGGAFSLDHIPASICRGTECLLAAQPVPKLARHRREHFGDGRSVEKGLPRLAQGRLPNCYGDHRHPGVRQRLAKFTMPGPRTGNKRISPRPRFANLQGCERDRGLDVRSNRQESKAGFSWRRRAGFVRFEPVHPRHGHNPGPYPEASVGRLDQVSCRGLISRLQPDSGSRKLSVHLTCYGLLRRENLRTAQLCHFPDWA